MREINPQLMERLGQIANRAVQTRIEGTGRPFIIGHLITQKCMCSCASCLWKNNDYEDVPTEGIKNFYAQAASEGFLATAFSGGEPFLRRELPEADVFLGTREYSQIVAHTDLAVASAPSCGPRRLSARRPGSA